MTGREAPPLTWEQYSIAGLIRFVEGEQLMGIKILASSEEETKFLGGRFGNIEDVRLPRKIVEDGATGILIEDDCWR